MLKKEKNKETQIISIKKRGGVFGQTTKIAINTSDSKTILVLPKMFGSMSGSFDL